MLPKTLKSNERGVAVYTDSVFQGYESISIVTSEQLDIELEEQAREEAIAEITAKKKVEILVRSL